MSIKAAILEILNVRGALPSETAERMDTRNRATFYRVLSGATMDPRISTLVELCTVLAIGPTDLLILAGLYQGERARPSLVDVELRRAFSEIQQLDEDARQQC